jgi:hypothetical protein
MVGKTDVCRFPPVDTLKILICFIGQVHDVAECSENFQLARNWLRTCLKEHRDCRQNHDPHFLPTRLIDIGDSRRGKISARLICTAESKDVNSMRYLALSHCWGTQRGKVVPKTVKSNLEDHLQELKLSSLSKTYREALIIAFKLRIRYAWIDSLCIIQDDAADFERECGQMNKVYSQATCTISVSPMPKETETLRLTFAGFRRQTLMMVTADASSHATPIDSALASSLQLVRRWIND